MAADPTVLSQGAGAVILWSALVLGLSGGFGHCLVMCGPLVAAVSLADGAAVGRADAGDTAADAPGVARALKPSREALLFQVGYHGGRIITYTAIGALLGLLGGLGRLSTLDGPFAPGNLARFVKLATGGMLVVTGAWLLVSWLVDRNVHVPETSGALARSSWFRRTAASLSSKGWRWALPLGMLMGLLPCGPLLPVEVAALGTGNALAGAAIMLAFGIGTVPALAGFGAASTLVGAKARGWFTVVTAVAILVLGVSITAQLLQGFL